MSDLISPTDFAREIGVTKQAVFKAIGVGRLPIYDESGLPAPADYAGRKFLRLDEARSKFALSRARVDDATIAATSAALERDLDPETPAGELDLVAVEQPATRSLIEAKTSKEEIQNELLRMRLARERGELISRAATLEAFETAGRNVSRSVQGIVAWAEELNGVAHEGGVPALTAYLRGRATDLATSIADAIATAAAGELETDDSGADAAD